MVWLLDIELLPGAAVLLLPAAPVAVLLYMIVKAVLLVLLVPLVVPVASAAALGQEPKLMSPAASGQYYATVA